MLGQVSQVDGNIQNNTSIKSQVAAPQAITVPQATKHFYQCFLQMPKFFTKTFYKYLNTVSKSN